MALVDLERTAPGPLSTVHGLALRDANIAENDCSACHGGWFESLAGACLDCHTGIDVDVDEGLGVHGNLTVDAENCGLCHGEHNGPGFQLAGPRSYRLADALGEPWGPGVVAREDAIEAPLAKDEAPGALPTESASESTAPSSLRLLARLGVEHDTSTFGREAIDHARLGFDLGGAHLDLDCVACHAQADADPLPLGSPRFRGLDAACASCHADDHAPVFPNDCTACHTQTDWDEHNWAPHAAFFPRQAAHADADCRDCHGADTPHSLEAKLGRRGGGQPEVRACDACHVVPHSDALLKAGQWNLASLPEPAMALGLMPKASDACARCHDVTAGAFARADARLPDKVHGTAGFVLGAAHNELACAACHAPSETERWPVKSRAQFVEDASAAASLAAYRAAHPGRERQDCAACHADPHAGQFAATDACAACHTNNAFTANTFDAERHQSLSLALTGSHADQACAACHQERPAAELLAEGSSVSESGARALVPHAQAGLHNVPPEHELDSSEHKLDPSELTARVRQFRGTDAACASCHGEPHAGFEFQAAEDCSECHGDLAFDLARDTFDHTLQTGFALAGAHGQEDCESCHVPMVQPTPEGRVFGNIAAQLLEQGLWVPEVSGPAASPSLAMNHGADTACALCHTDVHAGVFENDCGVCHTPTSFRLAPDDFDHMAATGFALSGRHQELNCAACHGRDPLTASERLPVAGNDCASCHQEPHAGQFAGAPRGDDCARCHTTVARFSEPSFRHNLDSDFKLEGRHRDIACGECHGVESIAGAQVRRYWPLDSECTSCHGAVTGSGALRRNTGGR